MANFTTYSIATHWLDGGLVLCNNIGEIDSSVYDNARFSWDDDDGEPVEVFQWFLTSWSESDVEYLERVFGLLFTYSDSLDCFVLCVPHWGTMWSGVSCEVLDDEWARINPDLLITESNPHPEYRKIRTF